MRTIKPYHIYRTHVLLTRDNKVLEWASQVCRSGIIRAHRFDGIATMFSGSFSYLATRVLTSIQILCLATHQVFLGELNGHQSLLTEFLRRVEGIERVINGGRGNSRSYFSNVCRCGSCTLPIL